MNSGQTKTKVECKKLRLAESIGDGRLYQTKVILEDNLNLNYIDKDGLSPLMRAFRIEDEKYRTRTAMVKLLLQHKVDVNLKDGEQSNALTWACKMNKLDLVKVLFAHCLQDIDLTTQDNQGNTPLVYAVQNNNITMVKLIVNAMKKFSLNVDQRNLEDKTAYYKAVELGFEECAHVLADVGKASRGIKVNPFLDFLVIENADYAIRANTTPRSVANGYVTMITRRAKRKSAKVGDVTRNVSGGKKRGKRSAKSGKIGQGFSATQGENDWTLPNPNSKRVLLSKGEKTNHFKEFKQEVDVDIQCTMTKSNRLSPRPPGTTPHISPRERPASKDRFLRLILDETRSEEGRRSRSPISTVSNNTPRSVSSVNNLLTHQKPTFNNFLKLPQRHINRNIVSVSPRCSTSVSGYTSTRAEPRCSAYSEWNSNAEHPPNTIRNLLALRAEQQAEISSYRKGLVIPTYKPGTDEQAEEQSAAENLSSASGTSTKSEATKKVIAAAKTIGLSAYWANKRKSLNKKD